jgi:hypothetical protein
MRNMIAIAFSALILFTPALAHAEGTGPAAPPTPPAAGSDIPTPPAAQPTLKKGNTALGTNGGIDSPTAPPVAAGTDTSTAAPGGQAESSQNGALSTPIVRHQSPIGEQRKGKPVTGDETPK